MKTTHFCSRVVEGVILAGLLLWFAAARSALAVNLDPVEQRIFDLIKDDPAQGRPRGEITVDPILTKVARARAADLANRGYFGHVNPDGFGPNYLVERAGYRLPDWWGDDPKANYVESIAAGYASPDAAWAGWMSSDHRIHLLALHSFFKDQTHVGVGHYYKEDSTDGHYWVVITAPPSGPVVKITSPRKLHRTRSPEIHLKGKATAAPALIQYSVATVDGTTDYRTADGTTEWMAHITEIQPGRNRIDVRSIGSDGSVLAQDDMVVKLIAYSVLNVTVEGEGAVSRKFAGLSKRRVGKRYVIEAKPARGWVFAGWSGTLESATPRLGFRMVQDMQLTAKFVPKESAAATP